MLEPEDSSGQAPADPAFALLIGLLALPWLMHALLVLGSTLSLPVLGSRALACLVLLGSSVGASLLARFARRPQQALAQPPSAAGAVSRPLSHATPALLRALQIAGVVAVGYPLVCAALLPVTAYDAIAYRLPTVAQWLDAGRIAWVTSDDPVRNGYPLGQEAVSALFAAVSGSLRLAGTTSYLFVAAAAVAIFWLARVLGVRGAIARAAAASFLLVPMLILNGPSGYVDAAFASACVCLFCCAALCDAGRAPPSPWLLFAAGMAAAHVLALKGTGLPFVIVVASLCVVRALWQRRAPALPALGAFVLAAAPGLFWPLRNLVKTGNPLYPISVSLGGKVLLPGVGSAEQILDVAGNTPALLASHAPFTRVLLTWLQWHGPALDFDYRLSGLGYAWLLFAVPAQLGLLYRFWREPAARAQLRPFGFVLLLTAACFVVQPMAWWSRYTLWLWGAGALALGCQLEALLGRARLAQLLLGAFSLMVVTEAGFALTHVLGLHLAVHRYQQPTAASPRLPFWQSLDLQHARQAKRWIDPQLWELGPVHDAHICRAEWKPGSDNANLDGVFAQLSPRPSVHIIPDDHVPWAETKAAWQRAGCPALLVFRGSPVLAAAKADPEIQLRAVRAFDPLYVLRRQSGPTP